MTNKIVILCFIANYLPGFRSGGPVRTIANFVERLGDRFDIRIACLDRDLGDHRSYQNVTPGSWTKVGKAEVLYLTPRDIKLGKIADIIRQTPHDVLYLNSFFGFGFTILPLLARWLRLSSFKPCVLAPRGELAEGALALKPTKKRLYLWFVRKIGLYNNVFWQASSSHEVTDIKRQSFARDSDIFVAPDLIPAVEGSDGSGRRLERTPGPLRLVFISRISPMKNLDFLLRVLRSTSKRMSLTIYGPHEDPEYLVLCQGLIQTLPERIQVAIENQVPHEKVRSVFSEFDLFALPTRGENFGHVIFESLSAGTPVLVSNRTPWQAGADGALTIIPLNEQKWAAALDEWAELTEAELLQRRHAALTYAHAYLSNDEPLFQNIALFERAIKNR